MDLAFIAKRSNSLNQIQTPKSVIEEELMELTKGKLVILPKNSGLSEFKAILESTSCENITVRAEDVPLFVDELSRTGVNCVGLTGEDLFREYLIKANNPKVRVVKKMKWNDPFAMFGKPTLCLMGPKGKTLNQLSGKTLKVFINSKYKYSSKNFLKRFENEGFFFKKTYVSGATELGAKTGLADLVIDIVVSGSSAQEAGLEVYERIMGSDAVLLGGGENANRFK